MVFLTADIFVLFQFPPQNYNMINICNRLEIMFICIEIWNSHSAGVDILDVMFLSDKDIVIVEWYLELIVCSLSLLVPILHASLFVSDCRVVR